METNNTNRAGIIGFIIVILVIIVGAGSYLYYNRADAPVTPGVTEEEAPEFASSCGLTVESPKVGEAVSFPLTVTGRINNTNAEAEGCSWTMFEGQAGVAELFYETKNGWSLPADTKPIAVADWMSTATTFSVTLNYDNRTEDFPSNYNFKIVLTEENPSGEGTPDVVEIPVVLK